MSQQQRHKQSDARIARLFFGVKRVGGGMVTVMVMVVSYQQEEEGEVDREEGEEVELVAFAVVLCGWLNGDMPRFRGK